MTDKKEDGLFSCTNMCWAIGVLVGFAIWLILMRNAGMNGIVALIIGAIAGFGLGWVLKNFFCTDVASAVAPVAAATAGAAVATSAAASAKPTAPAETSTIVEEAAAEDVVIAEDIADMETLDAPVTIDETPEVADPAPVEVAAVDVEEPAVVAPVEKPAAAPKKKAPAKKAPSKTPATDTDAGDVAEKKPRTMKAPRKAGADDLKLIKGVGPKLEGTLNELGFYHFDQVAKWGDAEIQWVDNRLKFKGRITRDGWIDQATILAAGGETEFSTRNKKA